MKKLFDIENLRCSYAANYVEGVSKVVLEINKLIIPKGKKVFIVGESGIGKSTILETLGMMNNTIVPDANAKFHFCDDETPIDMLRLWKTGDKELSAFRKKHFSFIFQSTNLMRNFTAYENIAFTRMLQGYSRTEAFARAGEVLKELGLGHIDEMRMTQELSGGQQQRLAIARAVLPDFTILFGDEPTGNLDSDNAVKAMELLSDKLSHLDGSSAIIVSHDMHLAVTFADIIIKIRKETRQSSSINDEIISYGVIDDKSVFMPDATGENWSNGKDSYTKNDFELYLKRW